MDLKSLRLNETAIFVPEHPTLGKLTEIEIEVYSSDTPEFKALIRHRLAMNEIEKKKLKTNGKNNEKDAEQYVAELVEAEKRGIELLAKVTKGWKGFEEDGKPFKFTYENAIALYSDSTLPYIRGGLDLFITDRVNFTKSLAKS